MKKIYLGIVLSGMFGVLNAQNAANIVNKSIQKAELTEAVASQKGAQELTQRGGGGLDWTEDFANGFDSDNGLWTVGGANGDVWDHVNQIWSGCYAGGAQGSLNFTTQNNGFMVFHADSVNCVDPDTEPNPTITQESLIGELISPAIDMTGQTGVLLQFEHRYRFCCTGSISLLVSVSNDGGETWTDYEVTEPELPVNEYNEQDLASVNISSAAANQSEVYIKWTWNAADQASHYVWAIDDISFTVPDENELVAGNGKYANFDPQVSDTWEDLEYSVYHTSQIRPLDFSIPVTNNGSVEQTGVYLEVNINNGIDTDETLTSDPVSVPVGETVTLAIDDYLPPSTLGTYEVTYTVIQDQEDANPDNNVDTRSFQVSDSDFARGGSEANYIANLGIGDEYIGGNGFHTTGDATLHCIGAAILDDSDLGKDFNYYLYNSDLEYIDETITLPVTEDMYYDEDDENYTWLSMLSGPYPLEAGTDYALMFHNYDEGDGNQVVVGISDVSAPDFSAYVFALYEEQDCFTDGCYTGSTYMVRAGLTEEFCLYIGAPEAEQVTKHELFPNPTNGPTTLEYTLLESAEVQIMLFDMNGRILMNEDKGTQAVGEYRFDYNFSDIASGNYTLSIAIGNKAINKKLVIK